LDGVVSVGVFGNASCLLHPARTTTPINIVVNNSLFITFSYERINEL
jgi:hypothetical protein